MTSTPPTTLDIDPPYTITLYTPSALASNPSLLHTLVELVNTAYATQSNFTKLRFPSPDDFLPELQPHGFTVVMFDSGKPICTASYRPWQPAETSVPGIALEKRPDLLAFTEQGLSWEVKSVAGTTSSRYSKKGLAGRCIAALQQEVLKANGGKEYLEWVQLAEIQAGPYWRRRGFEMVGESELQKQGMWGSKIDFLFSTLVRKIGGKSGGEDIRATIEVNKNGVEAKALD